MLKGTVKVMPAIVTLQSGAALARSSNMISASSSPSTDRMGRTLCLDANSVQPARGTRHMYDLGEPARGTVYAINERDYRAMPRTDAPKISEARACLEDRTVYYLDERNSWLTEWQSSDSDDDHGDGLNFVYKRNWKRARVPRGMLVSATALSSFAGNIIVRDI